MQTHATCLFCSVIVCCLLLAGFCRAQAFLFVSPNTRDYMPDEIAAESLASFEQSNFLAVADLLARELCTQAQVRSTVGIYAGTAENSSLITGCRNHQATYLGELLGRYSHQKWILLFDPAPGGSQHLLVAAIPDGHSTEIVKKIRQSGIHGASIVQEDKLVHVYFWITDSSQDLAVHSLTDSEHATLQDIPGRGTLIGNDNRAAAQRAFDRFIHTYEEVHHRSLSKLLWSKRLRDLGLVTILSHALP